MTLVDNILSVLERATPEEMTEGLSWYPRAHDLSWEISPGSFRHGAGVIAAYSPQCPWWRNAELAVNTFATGTAYGHTTNNVGKAQAIVDGAEPLTVLGGLKVRAFFRTIVVPEMPNLAVIDRHAYEVAHGAIMPDKQRTINKTAFKVASDAYVRAAREADMLPSEIQAITWLTWRREKESVRPGYIKRQGR